MMLSTFILSCSSSEETVKKEEKSVEEDIYVFDKVPSDTVIDVDETVNYTPLLTKTYYKVQIGAFTTKEKAESFASESRTKLQDDLDVKYSKEANLFVVQLSSNFILKDEAEKIKNRLRQMEEYKDAWVITVEE